MTYIIKATKNDTTKYMSASANTLPIVIHKYRDLYNFDTISVHKVALTRKMSNEMKWACTPTDGQRILRKWYDMGETIALNENDMEKGA